MRDFWKAGISEIDKTELLTEGIYQIVQAKSERLNSNDFPKPADSIYIK